MMLVDKRKGSGDLVASLPKLGVPVHETLLPSADVSFCGRGIGGAPVPIGVELKRLDDIVQCIEDGRFSGEQLPKLVKEYSADGLYFLCIEGSWKYDRDSGLLVVRRGKDWVPFRLGTSSKSWMAKDVDAYLMTMQFNGGVIYQRTWSREQTVYWLSTLYKWWTSKDRDQHTAHLAFHRPRPDRALLIRPGLTRRMAKEIDGIGWEKSAEVEKKFMTPQTMCNAPESEWLKIPGVGRTIAERTVKALRGWN